MRKQTLPGVWPGVCRTSIRNDANVSTSPSTSVRTSFTGTGGVWNPAPQACGSVSACTSASWMWNGSSSPQNSAAEPMWSKWPCVASTATGRFPSASSIACTRSGAKPGSTTTASSVPSAPISQQFVSNELSEKTSRYMARRVYPPIPRRPMSARER